MADDCLVLQEDGVTEAVLQEDGTTCIMTQESGPVISGGADYIPVFRIRRR